jgi:hypothetical protein
MLQQVRNAMYNVYCTHFIFLLDFLTYKNERGLIKNVGVCNYGPTLVEQCQEALAKRGVPLGKTVRWLDYIMYMSFLDFVSFLTSTHSLKSDSIQPTQQKKRNTKYCQ